MTALTIIPSSIQEQIAKRGLSAVLDEITHREEIARSELLRWKQIRQAIEDKIPHPLDEFVRITEEAFNAIR